MLVHASENRPRRHYTNANRCQFDRKRQAVQESYERCNCRLVFSIRLEVGVRGLRPAHEQLAAILGSERSKRENFFARQTEHLSRRRQKSGIGRGA